MCFKSCGSSIIKSIAITILIQLFLVGVVGIFLGAFDYEKISGPSFSNLQWKPISAVQISSIIYLLLISLLGLIVFSCYNTCFNVLFSIFLLLGILFLSIIGSLSLAASQNDWAELNLNCNTNYDSLKSVYSAIDLYIQHVDQSLCSKKCKCDFDKITTAAYANNSTINSYYKAYWTTNDSINSANEFKHCPDTVISQTYSHSYDENYLVSILNLKSKDFYSYMSEMEDKYKCTGFCNVEYFSTETNNNTKIAKYLFTDVNNGPPAHFGCLKSFLKYVPVYLKYFGAIALVLMSVLILIFVLAIWMCYFNTKI